MKGLNFLERGVGLGRGAARVLLAAAMGAGVLGAMASQALAVPVRVTYTDSNGEGFFDPQLGSLRRRSFEAAMGVWSRRLPGSVPIDVSASFDPMGGSASSATLGSARPMGLADQWNGATPPPRANTYYAIPLANNLAGGDIDPADPDIEARFNSDVDNPNVLGEDGFYYGLDGAAGTNSDFFAVVLHEIGHGLGFTGLLRSDGTFSANALTSFDRLLSSGTSATSPLLQGMSSGTRAQIIRSNSLFFNGDFSRAVQGSNPRLYAPAAYSGGSSVYHTDEATYRGTEELMTPLSTSAPHDAGPITFAMFRDIGWGFVGGSSAPTPTPVPVVRPANDPFARAQVLAGSSGRVLGTNVNATLEVGEPLNPANPGGASVWYRWTAPATGRATFSTAGSPIDTLLAVYTGSALNSLTLIGFNDDVSSTNTTSSLSFDAVAGRVYFIAVDGFRGQSSVTQGSLALSWAQAGSPRPTPTATIAPTPTPTPARPRNDDLILAQVLAGQSGRVGGTTAGATPQLGEPRHAAVGAGRSVWFRWTVPANGRYTFTTEGSTRDTVLGLYAGSAVNALRARGSDDDDLPSRNSSVTVALAAGNTIFIAVDAKGATAGPFLLSWSLAPLNDALATAQVLAGASGSARPTTVGASREVGEPLHAGVAGTRSVWFRWTAPASGTATFRTTGSAFNTLLAAYRGVSFSALTRLAFDDDDLPALTSTITFPVVAGQIYSIVVDGKIALTGSYSGASLLSWSLVSPPANDAFARAQVLVGASGTVNGTNALATAEVGEPMHASTGVGAGARRSVWYRWTAPGTGRASFVVYASLFSPIATLYSGTSLSTLRPVSTVTGSNSRSVVLSADVVRGTTYFLAVDSLNAATATVSGALGLRWSLTASAPAPALVAEVSSASALSASDSVLVRFTGPLTGVGKWSVLVNGALVLPQAAEAQGTQLLLALPQGSLRFGDRVEVLDAKGQPVASVLAR
jgi:hypothetical protein